MPANSPVGASGDANNSRSGDWRYATPSFATHPPPHAAVFPDRRIMAETAEQVSTRSIEEDKLLESALAEHWELDNRWGTALPSPV